MAESRKQSAKGLPGTQAPGRKDPAGDDEAARRESIALAAYYNAERRGFEPGGEVDDWLAAERSIAARGPGKGQRAEASARQGDGAQPPSGEERPDVPDLDHTGVEHIEPEQVRGWAKRLGVSAHKLREAIQRVGPVVRDVRRFLEEPHARP